MSSSYLVPIDDFGFFGATDSSPSCSWITVYPELCIPPVDSPPTYPTFSEVYNSFPFLPDDSLEEMGSATSGTQVTVQRTQDHTRLKVEDRMKLLQNDASLLSFGERSVTCGGCAQVIKLESRNGAQYYPGLWLKHKARCFRDEAATSGIRREKGKERNTE